MYHMYSILALKSRVPIPQLPHTGSLEDTPAEHFLLSAQDMKELKGTLTVLVARLLTQYIPSLSFLAAVVPKHICHKYSVQMAQKSDVAVIDVLMKNETDGKDMLDIMETMHGYLGKDYHADHCVLSGGDQLTCERQRASQRHVMCGNTRREAGDFGTSVRRLACSGCILGGKVTILSTQTHTYTHTHTHTHPQLLDL